MQNNMNSMPNGMSGGMSGGMPNMGGQNMNNGLYVPKSGGTSIASIIQNKKQENMGGNIGRNINPRQHQDKSPNPYGYGVDNNGYPISNTYNDANSIRSSGQSNNQYQLNRQSDRQSNNQPSINPNMDNSRDSGLYSDANSEHEEIMELANSVNNSLELLDEKERVSRGIMTETDNDSMDSIRSNNRNNKSNTNEEEEEDEDEEDEEDDEGDTNIIKTRPKKSKSIPKNVPDWNGMFIIEPLLLLTIFVIMSQPFVIDIASKNIDRLQQNEDGTIPLTGIIIYGIILVIIFMVFRRIIELQL